MIGKLIDTIPSTIVKVILELTNAALISDNKVFILV